MPPLDLRKPSRPRATKGLDLRKPAQERKGGSSPLKRT